MQQRGFTLIELMVSVTIFIIVMTVSMGALLAISAADRKAEAIKTIMNNLSFAMESMTRTLRTGYEYDCGVAGAPTDCNSPSPQSRVTFTSANSETISYCLGTPGSNCTGVSGTACTDGNGCSILRSVDGAQFQAMTAPEVRIDNLAFYVLGSAPGGPYQPQVVMTIDGEIDIGDPVNTTFQLQTSVTQRRYDQ